MYPLTVDEVGLLEPLEHVDVETGHEQEQKQHERRNREGKQQ